MINFHILILSIKLQLQEFVMPHTTLNSRSPINTCTGFCYRGYKKSDVDGGCDECPVNTYNSHPGRNHKCTPCPDGKLSPPGTTLLRDCQKKGLKTISRLIIGKFHVKRSAIIKINWLNFDALLS